MTFGSGIVTPTTGVVFGVAFGVIWALEKKPPCVVRGERVRRLAQRGAGRQGRQAGRDSRARARAHV